MSEYTPTTKEIIEHWAFVPAQDVDPAARDQHIRRAEAFRRWLAAHDAEVRAGVVAEEPEGERVFIERYGMYHAKFGGIGGDATSLTITREAWREMGEPDVLAVSWVPVEQGGER